MKSAKLLTAVLIAMLSLDYLAAESIDSSLQGIEPEIIDLLKTDEEVFRYDYQGNGIRFLPENPFSGDTIRLVLNMEPNVLSEALYLIPYTDEIKDMNLAMYNMIRQVRNIENVTYFSATRNAEVALFEDVYRVESMKNKRSVLPDDTVDTIPETESLFLYMKEVNFGSAYYRLDLELREDVLRLNLVNTSTIRKFVKVLDEEAMNLQLLIIPTDEGFLVHGLCTLDVHNKDFVQGLLDTYSAFYKRLYALETWIYNTMHGTDRSPNPGKPVEE